MKIRVLGDSYRNPYKAAIMASCVLDGHRLTINHPWCFIEVPSWTDFMKAVWHAAALCSQDQRGEFIHRKVPAVVWMDDGREYRTMFWISDDNKGVHYGVLR